jgi:hypothetical protein
MMKQLAWSSAVLEVMPSSENGVDLVLLVNLMKIFFQLFPDRHGMWS